MKGDTLLIFFFFHTLYEIPQLVERAKLFETHDNSLFRPPDTSAALHTVSFCEFLSGLVWILNAEFTKTFDILEKIIVEYKKCA